MRLRTNITDSLCDKSSDTVIAVKIRGMKRIPDGVFMHAGSSVQEVVKSVSTGKVKYELLQNRHLYLIFVAEDYIHVKKSITFWRYAHAS
jgi:hypothetical protein